MKCANKKPTRLCRRCGAHILYEARIAFDVSTSVDEITNDVRVCNIDSNVNEKQKRQSRQIRYRKVDNGRFDRENVNCWTESLNNAKVITKVAQAENICVCALANTLQA